MENYNDFLEEDFNPMSSYECNHYELKDEFDFREREDVEHEDYSSRAVLNLLRKNPK